MSGVGFLPPPTTTTPPEPLTAPAALTAPAPEPARCLHDLFAARAQAAPDAIAAVQGDRSISYGQLRERSLALAAALRERGVGPDVVVGLHLPRSIELLVGVLGIQEAGGAYLPLWVGHPAERLQHMLDLSGATVLVTDDAAALPAFTGARVPVDAVATGAPVEARRPTPDHLAYVIYTSGTTGTPKGVAVPHRAAERIVRSGHYGTWGPGEVFLQSCPLSFDASVFEVFGALANGATLALLPDQRVSAEAIAATVRAHGVTTAWLTPTLFNRMVDDGGLDGAGVRRFVVGGEVLSTPHVAKALTALGARVSNGYGPTEAGVFVCCQDFTADDLQYSPPPVGRPLPDTVVRVLDEHLRPVPDGAEGELYLGGGALARGYHGRPALTAASFVPDPHATTPGARLYRSGDLARVLPGGLVQVLGRADDQVKVRGNRVELGEVESALATSPGVERAAVVDRVRGAEKVLVAFVVPTPGAAPTVTALRARLAADLPDYMVPSEFHRLDALPLTAHDKLDRAALRADTTAPALELGSRFVQAASELELTLAALWTDVLDVPSVGVDDNYFDLGGTSLTVPELHRRIHEELGARLPATALYEHPTVRALAESIESTGALL
ncbi:non-ribosomal peptide synthetase [Actinokineospora bangkokensis]|uniref:Carrier domain-containing protein n=1 Tax=Actinokineospora bangkokensis TaxID=1193682 RepID=A0A1Q9LM27_9PSEU|nr:non-ribosomal peptide synthetase [Actinokineospora bangkokensis]OLR93054.1 hypothetical protein BJP25_19065 [Actinokineospora bangkokensis]